MGSRGLLKTVFGFDDFRPGQAEIIDAVTAGRNVLAIMPTGGGKSLCFQLPALLDDGVTVVISPLIALMRDQVRSLREAGIEAGALTSGNTPDETDAVFEALDEGRLKILYMAPERLASTGARRMLSRIGVTRIAVDEAHCVSQWGHDFRPDYLAIGALRDTLGVPLSAFTATADSETRDEIVTRLFGGSAPSVFLRGFDRPNIRLAFQAKDAPRKQILEYASARRGQAGIIYCATRAKTETLASALAAEGHATAYYHAGMDSDDRRLVETRFQREDGLIVAATVAFGMGIDKPDIRWVAHADLPKSIEAYYQEIGRAGRDGAPADTLTLFGADDIRLRRAQIDEGLAPADRRGADHGRLNALLGLAEAPTCRRQVLLGYFGEEAEPCGNCDVCASPPEVFDATVPVQKALSAALRTGERFGAGYLIDVLTGKMTDKVAARGHDRLPTFGAGADLDARRWQAVFRQMLGHDLIRPDPERFGGLRVQEAARDILKGEASITLRKDVAVKGPARTKVRSLISEDAEPLFAALKACRRAIAEAAKMPAYIVFPDKTLIEMAETKPRDLDAMAGISGVGAKKLERYGTAFLEVINGAPSQAPHPSRRKIAGRDSAQVYDRLLTAQSGLMRGADGTGKPMSCTASELAKVATNRPEDISSLERLLGQRRAERFGPAFLEALGED